MRDIVFLYAEEYKTIGSTIMRGQQLSELAKQFVANPERITYQPYTNAFNDSILFFTKGAVYFSQPDQLRKLKQQNNMLIFDLVDGDLPPEKTKFVDVIVAASRSAFRQYPDKYHGIKLAMIDHHVDPRLKRIKGQSLPEVFRIGYFGELFNTIITPQIKKHVDFIHTDTTKQDDSWIEKLPNYNAHYAIRHYEKKKRLKPFLKGFTAAYCGANILVQSSETEAVNWLGVDYPYLLHSEPTEANIIKAIKNMSRSFGSTEWHAGLKVMTKIKEEVSDQAIGLQLAKLFRSFEKTA